jgi:membrane associated rhomboid family serine protease
MVIPLGDEKAPLRISPLVTWALIAVNILVFLLELAQSDPEGFFRRWAVIPAEYAAMQDLPPQIPLPFWFTLLSSMFMHGGWLHLGGNMLFLWIFGDNVEDAMGHAKYLVFYLLCGLAASIAQIALSLNSEIPSLGASGAISGVLAAYLVMFPKRRVRVLVFRVITSMPAVVVIGMWIVLQFINGIGQIARTEETGGVAYGAHIGGFVAGFLLVWLFRGRTSKSALRGGHT